MQYEGSIRSYKSTGKSFDTVVVASVAFEKIVDPKLNGAALKLVKHMTGDRDIDLDNLKKAIKFCGPTLLRELVGRASFLRLHRSAFTFLGESLKTILHKDCRKELFIAFRTSINRKSVHINEPTERLRNQWTDFKNDWDRANPESAAAEIGN